MMSIVGTLDRFLLSCGGALIELRSSVSFISTDRQFSNGHLWFAAGFNGFSFGRYQRIDVRFLDGHDM